MLSILFNFKLLLLISLADAMYAQTYVSGFISANTTWNLAGAPYIIAGNALVSQGYALIIDPGVVVKFDTDKALQIDGELIAIGTPQNRITFTSNQITPVAGDWAKLHFADACVDAVFDTLGNYVSGCIMKYCDVLYGGGLGFGEIHIEYSVPYFSHCNIINSSNAGIYSDGSRYLLDSSAIKNCADFGLYFNSITPSGILFIQGDTIENNRGGIYFGIGNNNQNSFIKIKNNYFLSNTNSGAILISINTSRNVTIEGNYFINNSGSSIISSEGITDYAIICNKFLNNFGTVIYNNYNPINSGEIKNNIFDGNSSNSIIGSVIYAECRQANGTLEFSNNILRNNSYPSGSCFRVLPTLSNNQLLRIHHNEFSNNSVTSIIRLDGYVAGNSNLNFLYMKFNNFLDTNTTELYNNIPYGSPNIYADSNYWGGSTQQHIDSVIHDFFDYANLSVVYYLPILTSPATVDTTCSNTNPCALSVTGTKVSPSCFGNSNGSINITTTGGTTPYSYNWDNGITTEDRNGLGAGNYAVTVTDSSGCTASNSISITQPSELIVTTTSVTAHVTCYGTSDGAAKAIASGGTPPYSFLWSDGQTEDSPTGFPAGIYNVTVTDSLGCTASTFISIQEGTIVYVGVIIGFSNADINQTYIYSVNAVFSYNYIWSVSNGTIISGQGTNSIEVSWDSAGTGSIQLIAEEQGCPDTVSKTITLINPTGIHDAALSNIELYPNPTNGIFILRAEGIQGQATLKLFDAPGKQLWRQSLQGDELRQGIVIDLENVSEGIFFLNIQTENGSRVLKVVKY